MCLKKDVIMDLCQFCANSASLARILEGQLNLMLKQNLHSVSVKVFMYNVKMWKMCYHATKIVSKVN